MFVSFIATKRAGFAPINALVNKLPKRTFEHTSEQFDLRGPRRVELKIALASYFLSRKLVPPVFEGTISEFLETLRITNQNVRIRETISFRILSRYQESLQTVLVRRLKFPLRVLNRTTRYRGRRNLATSTSKTVLTFTATSFSTIVYSPPTDRLRVSHYRLTRGVRAVKFSGTYGGLLVGQYWTVVSPTATL